MRLTPATLWRRRPRRGAAAAEFALLLPVLTTIVLGCVDVGRFAYNYIALANAVRAGAAYASMNNYTASTLATWKAGVQQAAKDEMTQQVGFDNGDINNLFVTVPDPTQDANGLRRVLVTASYPFTTKVNWSWTGLGLPHSLTLQQQAEIRLIR